MGRMFESTDGRVLQIVKGLYDRGVDLFVIRDGGFSGVGDSSPGESAIDRVWGGVGMADAPVRRLANSC